MKFVDTIQLPDWSKRTSESFSCNGEYFEDLIEGYKTLYTVGRELLPAELTTIESERYSGARFLNRRYPSREITVGYQLCCSSAKEVRAAFKILNLKMRDELTLIFDDEPLYYYTAYLTDVDDVPEGKLSFISEFTLTCPNPFKRSLVERQEKATNGKATFNYDGSEEAYPEIEVTFKSACGYIGLTNQDGRIIQIGNVENDVQSDAPFKNGDILTLKIEEGEIYAKGSNYVSTDVQYQLNNIGNQWDLFTLTYGVCEVAATVSSYATMPDIVVKYHEVQA
jgi:predicted phage tail component-like protein